jgi:hypothetical protein
MSDDDLAWRMSLPLSVAETVDTLARVAVENPTALRLATQLLGVPPCPKCDFVMRPGHICYADAPTYDPQDSPSPEYPTTVRFEHAFTLPPVPEETIILEEKEDNADLDEWVFSRLGKDDSDEPAPGTIVVGEPEYLGALPIRSEITVLPADPPGRAPVGFTVFEVNGGEVYKPNRQGQPLTRREDIQPGDELIVPTLVGTYKMTAILDDDSVLWAQAGTLLANLEYDGERRGWVSSFSINALAVKALGKKSDEP